MLVRVHPVQAAQAADRAAAAEVGIGLYKILFRVWAFVHESILFFAYAPFV